MRISRGVSSVEAPATTSSTCRPARWRKAANSRSRWSTRFSRVPMAATDRTTNDSSPTPCALRSPGAGPGLNTSVSTKLPMAVQPGRARPWRLASSR